MERFWKKIDFVSEVGRLAVNLARMYVTRRPPPPRDRPEFLVFPDRQQKRGCATRTKHHKRFHRSYGATGIVCVLLLGLKQEWPDTPLPFAVFSGSSGLQMGVSKVINIRDRNNHCILFLPPPLKPRDRKRARKAAGKMYNMFCFKYYPGVRRKRSLQHLDSYTLTCINPCSIIRLPLP